MPSNHYWSRERDDATVMVSVRGLRDIMRRRRRVLMLCTIIGGLGGIAVAVRLQPTYRATATLRVDERASSLPALDVLRQLAGGAVNTEMAALASRPLLEDAVDSLGLRLVLRTPRRLARHELFGFARVSRDAADGRYELARSSRDSLVLRDSTGRAVARFWRTEPVRYNGIWLEVLPRIELSGPVRFTIVPFPDAVDALNAAIRIQRPDREASIISVSYWDHDATLARDVPNLLIADFINSRQRSENSTAARTADFLRAQVDSLSQQIAIANDSLRQFRELEQAVALDQEASAQVTQLADLQGQRNAIEAERGALASLVAEVEAEHQPATGLDPSPYRRLVAFPTLIRNQAVSELLRSLTAVEDERVALLARRTAEDPDVQVLSVRVTELEDQLLGFTTTYLRGLGDHVKSFDATIGRFRRGLDRIPAKQITLTSLERKPKVLGELFAVLQTRLQEAQIATAAVDPTVRVVSPATLPRKPAMPTPPLVAGLGVVLGLLMGALGAMLREQFDPTLRTRRDVQRLSGVQVIGVLPHLPRGLRGIATTRINQPSGVEQATADTIPVPELSRSLVVASAPWSSSAEAFRILRTNLLHALGDNARAVTVASPRAGDGKTFVAANLAVSCAENGKRVLLIDGDTRRGQLGAMLRVPCVPGLSEALENPNGGIPVTPVQVRRRTLDVLAAGAFQEDRNGELTIAKMRALLKHCQAIYDVVIVDSPPLNMVADAAVLAASTDGVLLVARAGTTTSESLTYAMDQLQNIDAGLLGICLNDGDFGREVGDYNVSEYYRSAVRTKTPLARFQSGGLVRA